MRSNPLRSILLVVAATLLLAPAAAFAQTDEFEAHAEGEGFLLSVPDVVDIGGGNTEADLTSDPTAHAWGAGFLLAEDSISEVTIERDGVSERDPDEGENCGGPDLPDPFADLADLACSVAEGDTTGSRSSASASATGAEVSVTGADVAALVAFLLSHINESELGTAIDEIERQIIDPAVTAFAEGCIAVLEDSPLGDVITEVSGGAEDLINQVEQGTGLEGIEFEADDPCGLLVQYVTNPPVITDDPIGMLQAQLQAILDGVSLLDLTLAGSDSSSTESAAAVTAAASALGLDIALPSLNVLGNLVDAVIAIVDEFVTTVETDILTVSDALPDDFPDDLSDGIDAIFDTLPLDLRSVLDSDQPLLRVTGGQASASATYDRASADVTTDGTVAPLVLDLDDALAALLQMSDQDPITIPEGGSQTIAEGTPLESTATLAACTNEEQERNRLPGAEIHCAGLDLVLLKGVIGDDPETEEMDGGLRVAGAAVTASAFGQAGVAEAPQEPTMPETGGGAALIGVVALAGAFGLRRLRGRD